MLGGTRWLSSRRASGVARVNPIKEWLARVAAECGTPSAMLDVVSLLCPGNNNSRRLIVNYAKHWERQLRLEADVMKYRSAR